jgi:hypothetical protein
MPSLTSIPALQTLTPAPRHDAGVQLETFEPGDNRENGNRPYHRVMEELLDLFVPVCVPQRSRECTQSPAGLATVYSQLTNFSPSARGRPGPSQVVLPFVFAAQSELQAGIEAVPHPQELAGTGCFKSSIPEVFLNGGNRRPTGKEPQRDLVLM